MTLPSAVTLGRLRDEYLAWLEREVAAGRYAWRTLDYYRRELRQFVDLVGADRPIHDLTAWDLESNKGSWHRCQAAKRLLSWAVRPRRLLDVNPFAGVSQPEAGRRERTLDRAESAHLLRACTRPMRFFLCAMRHTLARPQEVRALRWRDLHESGHFFALREFKGRRRRREKDGVRWIMLDGWMRRLLERWRARRNPGPDEYVFLNARGRPWTANALRCRMRRARVVAGLAGDEPVVCYTVRHTSATEATANGVLDRQLADLMGHSSTRTTQRYQHLRADHLRPVIEQATKRPA